MRIILPRRAPFAEPLGVPGKGYMSLLSKAAGKLCIYWFAYQKGRAAEHVLAHLRRMSDEDLAKHGLSRAGIARHVRDSLEVKD